jgi:serine/threonine protein kinase
LLLNNLDPPFWLAPEIINKQKNLTTAVDIWSLGCVIIEMATRNPPWSNITTNCQEVINLIGNSNGKFYFPHYL